MQQFEFHCSLLFSRFLKAWESYVVHTCRWRSKVVILTLIFRMYRKKELFKQKIIMPSWLSKGHILHLLPCSNSLLSDFAHQGGNMLVNLAKNSSAKNPSRISINKAFSSWPFDNWNLSFTDSSITIMALTFEDSSALNGLFVYSTVVHIVWKSSKMSNLNFGIFYQFLSY